MSKAPEDVHVMRLDLPIVFDGLADADDLAVASLVAHLAKLPGVEAVHVLPANMLPPSDGVHFDPAERSRISPSAALCVHFDSLQVTRAEITTVVLRLGEKLCC